MGFLKKERAPSELPELALSGSENIEEKKVEVAVPEAKPEPIIEPSPKETISNLAEETEDKSESLEFSNVSALSDKHEQIKQQISEEIDSTVPSGFFDKVLDDINGEIQDMGKLEEWYNNKFLPEDIVSNMRGYWEGNKADILIQSFGAEYKRKINEKIKKLQELEGDWREIYFKLIKKEEEMKKEERELKDTLSEFVNLCKNRKSNG